MTMITPSYLGETIEYSSLHACRSTLEDPMGGLKALCTFTICGRCSCFEVLDFVGSARPTTKWSARRGYFG